jgi:hypothetical protein
MTDHDRRKLIALHQIVSHGKLPSTLLWTDVISLIEHLGKVEPQGRLDEFAFVVGTQREVFQKPHTHGVLAVSVVARLRKFLKAAGREAPRPQTQAACRMIVTINHDAAHIYQENGVRLQDEVTIKAYDPFGYHSHATHFKQPPSTGDSFPPVSAFFEQIAKSLMPATDLVLIGEKAEAPSAVDAFLEYLNTHHSELASRVRAMETRNLEELKASAIATVAKQHMMAAA